MNVSIASSNIWGLPWPLSVHKSERIKKLASIIQKEKIDILALQEIWSARDITKIQKLLPEYHVLAKSNTIFNPSGLAFVSRFPLEKFEYAPFELPKFHQEYPSRKGIAKARIPIPGKTIWLVNTHFFFAGTPNVSRLQAEQMNMLSKALPSEPTILFGDFNIRHDQLKLPQGYRLLSDPNALTVDSQTLYAQKRFNKINGSSRTPDLLYANFSVRVVRSYTITTPLVSDHFPVIAELEIT